MPSRIPVGQSGGRPWWCAASTVNVTTPTAEVTKVDASAARGAGDEDAAERPVLTVRQVFDLAERVGRRPIGNIRKVPDGYRLRFSRNGEMRTSPERYATRQEAERALWKMADVGRADCTHDRRFYALLLLATFSSLRWGEVTALRRSDLDLEARTVRIRPCMSNGQPASCC